MPDGENDLRGKEADDEVTNGHSKEEVVQDDVVNGSDTESEANYKSDGKLGQSKLEQAIRGIKKRANVNIQLTRDRKGRGGVQTWRTVIP